MLLDETTKQSEAILAHHLQTMLVDWDGFMQDYAEDAVMVMPPATIQGKAGIRAFFEALPVDLVKQIQVSRQEVVLDTVALYWSAEPYIHMGSDVFVIRDGKIVVQIVTIYPVLTF